MVDPRRGSWPAWRYASAMVDGSVHFDHFFLGESFGSDWTSDNEK